MAFEQRIHDLAMLYIKDKKFGDYRTLAESYTEAYQNIKKSLDDIRLSANSRKLLPVDDEDDVNEGGQGFFDR